MRGRAFFVNALCGNPRVVVSRSIADERREAWAGELVWKNLETSRQQVASDIHRWTSGQAVAFSFGLDFLMTAKSPRSPNVFFAGSASEKTHGPKRRRVRINSAEDEL